VLNRDAAASPIAGISEPCADGNARAEGDDRRGPHFLPDDHDLGIVYRDVDHRRAGGLYDDGLRFLDDDHLFVGLQVTGVLSLLAKALDRGHDVFLLYGDGVTQRLRPVEVAVQQLDHFRVVHERQHAGIPGQCLDGLLIHFALMLLDKSSGLHDRQGISGRRQDLGNQHVGIQCNGSDQFIELSLGEFLGLLGGVRGPFLRERRVDWRQQERANRDQDRQHTPDPEYE